MDTLRTDPDENIEQCGKLSFMAADNIPVPHANLISLINHGIRFTCELEMHEDENHTKLYVKENTHKDVIALQILFNQLVDENHGSCVLQPQSHGNFGYFLVACRLLMAGFHMNHPLCVYIPIESLMTTNRSFSLRLMLRQVITQTRGSIKGVSGSFLANWFAQLPTRPKEDDNSDSEEEY